MKNRLEQAITRAHSEGRKLFCAYVTAGYPNLGFTRRLIRSMESIGVDFVEVGFPFSDPLADGPIIQRASEHALKRKVTLRDCLTMAASLRRSGCRIPLIFFSYYNPIFHHGLARTVASLATSGFDGVICPDLPPDEDSFFPREASRKGLKMIFLAAPTSSDHRLRVIAHRSAGFIYYVSLKGVTGMRRNLSHSLRSEIQRIKKLTSKPILVGFGVSSTAQVREVCRVADGVIVGSALIAAIQRSGGEMGQVLRFIRSLVNAARGRVALA